MCGLRPSRFVFFHGNEPSIRNEELYLIGHDERLRRALDGVYRLDREVGAGGMATVYLAEDLKHHRRVAVKVLRPELAQAIGTDRFLREIEVTASLSHPHILPLFDSGEADGFLYYVMPFVEGESLRARLARDGTLPVDEALQIAREVADAMSYAHRQGVVHRDLKPENILLHEGHALVADFGIARAISSAGGSHLTQTGIAIGTPAYMSPEQATGSDTIDQRSDIYSLAAVLYESLAGRPPFAGPTAQAVIAAHFTERPDSIRRHRRNVPVEVERALERALAKSPDDRFAGATEFREALSFGSLAARGAPPKSRRRLALAGAGLAALLIAVALVVVPRSSGETLDDSAVVVVPFRVRGADPGLAYLREGMVDLLAAKLTGDPGPRAVDSRTALVAWRRAVGSEGDDMPQGDAATLGRELGAGQVLLGSIVGTPAQIVLTVRVVNARTGRTAAETTERAPVDSLLPLVDRVVASLLLLDAGEQPKRLAQRTTTSLGALQAFLRGQALYRQGRYADAMREYGSALEQDSTFALAAFRLSMSAGWVGGTDDIMERAAIIAARHRDRLAPVDLAVFNARFGARFPEPTGQLERLALRRQAVELAPESQELWYELGESYFHSGDALGLADWPAHARAAFVRLFEFDSTRAGVVQHLIQAMAREPDRASLRELATWYLAQAPDGSVPGFVRWRVAESIGDSAELARFRASMPTQSVETLRWVAVNAQDDGVWYAGAREALAERARRQGPRAELFERQLGLHAAALNAGRPNEARSVAERLRALQPDSQFVRRLAMLTALYGDGDSTAAAHAAAELRAAPSFTVHDRCALDQWELWSGRRIDPAIDARTVAGNPREARVLTLELCAAVVSALEALRAGTADAPARARHADSLLAAGPFSGRLDYGDTDYLAVAVARLLLVHGDSARALAAVRRRPYFSGHKHYLARSLHLEAALASALGDHDGARQAYRYYLALRVDPEASLRREVQHASEVFSRLTAR